MIQQNNNISIGKIIWESMPQSFLDSFSFLFTIAKVISIIFAIYLIFLLISAIIKIRQASRIKSIEKNVSEINNKIDRLLNAKKEKNNKSHNKK